MSWQDYMCALHTKPKDRYHLIRRLRTLSSKYKKKTKNETQLVIRPKYEWDEKKMLKRCRLFLRTHYSLFIHFRRWKFKMKENIKAYKYKLQRWVLYICETSGDVYSIRDGFWLFVLRFFSLFILCVCLRRSFIVSSIFSYASNVITVSYSDIVWFLFPLWFWLNIPFDL